MIFRWFQLLPRHETVMLLLSILCDTKPLCDTHHHRGIFISYFNRSENICGYESKGLIRSLDQTDCARLYEIFGVHQLCLWWSVLTFYSLKHWLPHCQLQGSAAVLWSDFMSTEDKEGISALILSNHLCSDVNCRFRDEGPVHSVTVPSCIMMSSCPQKTSDFVIEFPLEKPHWTLNEVALPRRPVEFLDNIWG